MGEGLRLGVTGAGEVVVVARQAGTGDYLPAADEQQRRTVRPAPLTLTAADAARTAGLLLPALSFRVTGLVNGDAAAVVTGAAATTVATAASPAGSYPVLVTGGAAANSMATRVPGTPTLAAPRHDAAPAGARSSAPGRAAVRGRQRRGRQPRRQG